MTRCEINGQPYKTFDPKKEWVILTECPAKQARIVAHYD